jgi:hypothetical protein
VLVRHCNLAALGAAAAYYGQPTEVVGTQRTGSFLRANATTPATTRTAAEPIFVTV